MTLQTLQTAPASLNQQYKYPRPASTLSFLVWIKQFPFKQELQKTEAFKTFYFLSLNELWAKALQSFIGLFKSNKHKQEEIGEEKCEAISGNCLLQTL